jgi:hypothetical protein
MDAVKSRQEKGRTGERQEPRANSLEGYWRRACAGVGASDVARKALVVSSRRRVVAASRQHVQQGLETQQQAFFVPSRLRSFECGAEGATVTANSGGDNHRPRPPRGRAPPAPAPRAPAPPAPTPPPIRPSPPRYNPCSRVRSDPSRRADRSCSSCPIVDESGGDPAVGGRSRAAVPRLSFGFCVGPHAPFSYFCHPPSLECL